MIVENNQTPYKCVVLRMISEDEEQEENINEESRETDETTE